jgi:hypothetical protein
VEKLRSTTDFIPKAHPEYGVVAQHDFRRVIITHTVWRSCTARLKSHQKRTQSME